MIDAGSAGSRLHVYRFHQCDMGDPIQLESEDLFVQTIPGLSAYPDEPEQAALSLDPLLRQALKTVPASMHKRTPLAVKATAGLRLLGEAKGECILDSVYRHLTENYPFPIGGKDNVAIMDGSDEGKKERVASLYVPLLFILFTN